jgi:anti-sigma factor RsiW
MSGFDRIGRKLWPRRKSAPLTCAELVEIITDYLEGTLSPADRRRFDAHLDRCEGCRTYLDQMRETILAVGRLREEDVPPAARESLLQAFRAWSHR